MTPASSARLQRATLDSPIGRLVLEADDGALVGVQLPGTGTRSAVRRPVPAHGTDGRASSGPLRQAVRQLEEYFEGRRRRFDVPLALSGTDFQCQVWRALADIPYGEVVSYAELAAMVGRPTAFRAVGQANGANPIPVVLPCHRVVASGGRIGGYGGGLAMKRKLLALEGVGDFS